MPRLTHHITLILALLWAGLWPTTLSAQNGLRLDLSLEYHDYDASAKATAAPPPSTQEIVVILGETGFSYELEKTRVCIDLKSRRMIILDLESRTYTDDSLFAVVGFRVAEYPNRRLLSEVITGDKPSGIARDAIADAHELSVYAKADYRRPEAREEDGFRTFLLGREELFAYSLDHEPVPEPLHSMFVQFIRYYLGGLPEILFDLEDSEGIPRNVRFNRLGTSGMKRGSSPDGEGSISKSFVFRITKIEAIEYAPCSVTGFELTEDTLPESAYLQLKLESGGRIRSHARARSKQLVRRAKDSLADGYLMTSYLAYLEAQMTTGRPMPDSSTAALKKFQGSPEVVRFSRSIGVQDDEMKVKAVEYLRKVRKVAPESNAPQLKVYEANFLADVGEGELAEKLFLEALEANDLLAGAWFDLGGLYHKRYETPVAWRCWDIARKIAPDHGLLKNADRREARLIEWHPEYFRY